MRVKCIIRIHILQQLIADVHHIQEKKYPSYIYESEMCQMNTYTSTAYTRYPSYTLKKKCPPSIYIYDYMRVEWCFNKKFIKQKLKGPP